MEGIEPARMYQDEERKRSGIVSCKGIVDNGREPCQNEVRQAHNLDVPLYLCQQHEPDMNARGFAIYKIPAINRPRHAPHSKDAKV
ncbi:MAG: hypothetical protein BWY95_01628 [Bacteroidetes bacterium ADurb.BinA104]|nr:MAG: hypothetical protein BWY95_01628 [Bacteroidetes bacterium ADurb.BinA104]